MQEWKLYDNLTIEGVRGREKKRFQYPTFKTLDVEAKSKENLWKSRVPGVEGKKRSNIF